MTSQGEVTYSSTLMFFTVATRNPAVRESVDMLVLLHTLFSFYPITCHA